MTLEGMDASFWLGVVVFIWNGSLTYHAAMNRRQHQLAMRLDSQERNIETCAARLALLDAKLGELSRLESQLDRMEHDLNGVGERITRLDSRFEQAPSHRDLGDIHEKVNEMGRDLAELCGTMKANEALLRSIHQQLMREK